MVPKIFFCPSNLSLSKQSLTFLSSHITPTQTSGAKHTTMTPIIFSELLLSNNERLFLKCFVTVKTLKLVQNYKKCFVPRKRLWVSKVHAKLNMNLL